MATRGSSRSTSCSMPLLPRKRRRSRLPATSAWRLRSVVRPNELVRRARTRRCRSGRRVVSSRRTSVASTVSRRGVAPTGAARSARDALPDARQRRAELEHALELVGVAREAPVGVIAVLLAAARVASGRLEVAVRRAGRSRPARRPAGSPGRGCAAARRPCGSGCRRGRRSEAVADADATDPGRLSSLTQTRPGGVSVGADGGDPARAAGPALTRRRRSAAAVAAAPAPGRASRAARVVDRRRHALRVLRRGRRVRRGRRRRFRRGQPGAQGQGSVIDGSSSHSGKIAASDAPERPIAPRLRALRHRCHEENPAPARPSQRWHDGCVPDAIQTLAPASGAPDSDESEPRPRAMNFPALRTTQKQQHTVTPRLQHAVRLLQLSSLDFAQEVHDAMGRNPFLEVEDSPPDARPRRRPATHRRRPESRAASISRRRAPIGDAPYERENWQQSSSSVRQQGGDNDIGALDMIAADVGLRQHLHGQINVLPLEPARPRARLRDHRIARRRRLPARRRSTSSPTTSGMPPAVEADRDADRAQARAVARPAAASARAASRSACCCSCRRSTTPSEREIGARDRHRPPRPPGPARRQRPGAAAQAHAGARSRRCASASAT